VGTHLGAAAAGISEGAAAFRLLNSAQIVEAALAAGLSAVNSPKILEFSRILFSPCKRLSDPAPK
jgi:hypothetical protein